MTEPKFHFGDKLRLKSEPEFVVEVIGGLGKHQLSHLINHTAYGYKVMDKHGMWWIIPEDTDKYEVCEK